MRWPHAARVRPTLVEAGALRTLTYQEPGGRQRRGYHLTKAGADLQVVLGALQQWGDTHRPRPTGPSALRRTPSTGEPVRVAFVAGEDVVIDIHP